MYCKGSYEKCDDNVPPRTHRLFNKTSVPVKENILLSCSIGSEVSNRHSPKSKLLTLPVIKIEVLEETKEIIKQKNWKSGAGTAQEGSCSGDISNSIKR